MSAKYKIWGGPLFMLVFLGCGSYPQFSTQHGITVEYEESVPITKQGVECLTDIFIDELLPYFDEPSLRAAISKVDAWVQKDKVEWDGKEYSGLMEGWGTYVWWYEGLGTNAFAHEMLHVVLHVTNAGDTDRMHVKPIWLQVTETKRRYREECE